MSCVSCETRCKNTKNARIAKRFGHFFVLKGKIDDFLKPFLFREKFCSASLVG